MNMLSATRVHISGSASLKPLCLRSGRACGLLESSLNNVVEGNVLSKGSHAVVETVMKLGHVVQLFGPVVRPLRSWLVLLALIGALATTGQVDMACPVLGKELSRRNELGLNLFGLVSYDQKTPWLMPDGPRPSIMNGLMFKRHYGRHAFRAGLDLFRDSYDENYGPPPDFASSCNTFRADLRFGYQRSIAQGKIRPYVAADFGLSYGRTTGEGKSYNGTFGPGTYEYQIDRNRFGFGFVVGVDYRPFNRFSISAESSLILAWYKNREVGSSIGVFLG